jgi:hypothetical protein
MTGSFSDYWEAIILDETTGKSPSATRYIALLTATPTDASTGTTIVEPSGGSYARKSTAAADWNSAASGSTSNANAITFVQATGDWGAITHFAICDAATTGNVLAWGSLTATKTILNGDTASFAAGSLIVTLD